MTPVGDRDGALLALHAAEAAVESRANNLPMISHDDLLHHVSAVQALLEPERVDTSLARIIRPDDDYRIWVLITAVEASTDDTSRYHWLAEIDGLALAVDGMPENRTKDKTTFVCWGAADYAIFGEYRRALYLLQRRGCNKTLGPSQQLSKNLERIFRIAAVNNDVLNVLDMIPPLPVTSNDWYTYHLEPVIFGLVRIGRYQDALQYIRQLAGGQHELAANLIGAIGQSAGADFPFEEWLPELLGKRSTIRVSQWDVLHVLFAACSQARGIAGCKDLAETLSGDEFATAHVGMAEGLRGFRPAPQWWYSRH